MKRERKVRAKTQKEAVAKRDDVLSRVGAPVKALRFSKKSTVHELAQWWLTNVAVDRGGPPVIPWRTRHATDEDSAW